MRLIIRITLTLLLVAGLLAGCGGDGNGKSTVTVKQSDHYSAISIAITDSGPSEYTPHLSPQAVTIKLGKLKYWRLGIEIHNSGDTTHRVELAAESIIDPSSVKYLDTSQGASVMDEYYDGSGGNNDFVAQVVAGQYYLTVDGKRMPVTIKVLAGSAAKTVTTKAP